MGLDQQVLQHIIDIKSDVAGIKSVMESYNRRLKDFDEFRTKTCPDVQKEIREDIVSLKLNDVKWRVIIGMGSSVVTILLYTLASIIKDILIG